MTTSRFGIALLSFLLLIAPQARAQTQLKLDGSLPHERTGDITQLQSGPDYEISEDFGWRSGANLFHSFELFDIATNESATFTANPQLPDLANVIARVTGGEPSDIDGRLASTIETADLYFLNPAGILFGGDFQVDVPRSLFVSTAHRLDFSSADGFLDLLNPADPNLSVEPPAAFGFYAGGPRAQISFFNPNGRFPPKQFSLSDGEILSVVGGDVAIENYVRVGVDGGRIQLVATGDADATVPIDAAGFSTDGVAGLGEVRLAEGAALDTFARSDPNAESGTVVIRGGRLVMRGESSILAGGRVGGDGASIDVETSGSIETVDSNLSANAQGPHPSGGIRLSTGELTVSQGSRIRTRQVGSAPAGAVAGDIVVDADRVRVDSGGQLIAQNNGPGSVGNIRITADHIDLDQGEVSTSTTGAGSVGGISFIADEIDLAGSQVSTSTTGAGSAGDVSLDADRIAVVDSTVAADGGVFADAGAVMLAASEIELRGGKTQVRTTRRLAAAPVGPPPPGSPVTLTATGGTVRILDGAAAFTQTGGPNPGGDVTVTAAALEIIDGGIGSSGDPRASAIETGTTGQGAAGAIRAQLGSLRVGRSEGGARAGRLATAVAPGASGPGGAIDVHADSVSLDGGGQISSSTLGAGAAGRIDLTVTGDVLIRGDNFADGRTRPSGVFARSDTNADGNDITIDARSIEVTDGGEISTRALGAGRSGNLLLIADELVRVAGSGEAGTVVTARGTDGRGGNVTIDADRLEVLDGASVDVSTAGTGPGGLLRVIAGDVVVEGAGPIPKGGGEPLPATLAAQAEGTGDAVGIVIGATRSVRVGPGGRISALSEGNGGSPGDIEIEAKDIRVDGGVVTAVSGAGGGGGISLTAVETAKFRHGAEVTVSSFAGGNAGTIVIDAQEVEFLDSAIEADADAFGGNVEIRSAKLTQLLDSRIVALSRGGSTEAGLAGGNVDLQGGAVVLNRSEVVADGLDNADGGNITIEADPYLESTDSRLSASSEFGVDGLIVVSAPIAEVVGELSQLPSNFLDASSQLEDACLARSGSAGSFKVQRARVRPPPDALFTPGDAVAPGCGGP